MKMRPDRWDWNHALALLLVLAVHGAVLYGLSSVRVIPHPSEAVTLFVTLISPPQPQPSSAPPTPASVQAKRARPPEPPRQPKPVEREAPRPAEPPHYHLATEAPVVSPTEATELRPPSEPAIDAPESGASDAQSSPSQIAGPVSLASDLALVCPVRTPPPYPSVSRRLGETGKAVLQVELDETGRVTAAKVITSSGHPRLDSAALAAVKSWRCQPAQREGQAVRAVALQPFEFTLEGR
ncbi:MAG TPA: TonB family protein [Thiobacillus sp.]|nr:TonB family protein [Thiobacillus sp.]